MLLLTAALQYVICDGVRYYSYSRRDCLSVTQCLENDEFPYALGKVCIGPRPDTASGMTRDGHGAYTCPSDRYILVNETSSRCVGSAAECPGFYVSEERKACVNSSWACVAYANQYGYVNVTRNYCVLFNDC